MQSVRYQPVPFSIGGVAYPRAIPVAGNRAASSKRFGPEDSKGFKPMFFARNTVTDHDAEAQLRLDWEQAAAQIIARAYSDDPLDEKGALFDFTV
ncbi:hypothetical protein [Novosphingobium album (ex Hu et al. 2023)]|uniref:Uncharacterized protein n=1 Tax=Novosphingobium album (ex Hu et al. 2023) TaxID=2930093 RepID=A0ABT0B5U7_9SPHN|nr:hypothetical protein [Novosphingobium album (ex Hu et al. 2023)]MCJ2180407.1 hypothetical protein [Novosphingobium album (ex Hu et al. 2023)]